jgi:hypothetical protein
MRNQPASLKATLKRVGVNALHLQASLGLSQASLRIGASAVQRWTRSVRIPWSSVRIPWSPVRMPLSSVRTRPSPCGMESGLRKLTYDITLSVVGKPASRIGFQGNGKRPRAGWPTGIRNGGPSGPSLPPKRNTPPARRSTRPVLQVSQLPTPQPGARDCPRPARARGSGRADNP